MAWQRHFPRRRAATGHSRRSSPRPIDVNGEVGFKRRVYNGTRSRAVETFRVVGVWNDKEDRYHLYITNLPAEDYSAPDIAKLYQARWEVELLFRELKTVYGLDEITSGKPEWWKR